MKITIDMEDVFYDKVIAICPSCKGTGKNHPLDLTTSDIGGLCPTCDGMGRVRLRLRKLMETDGI